MASFLMKFGIYIECKVARNNLLLKIFLLLLTIAIFNSPRLGFAQGTTAKVLGENRVLALCVLSENSNTHNIYPNIDWDGFEERDLVIVEILNKAVQLIKFEGNLNLFLRTPVADKQMRRNLQSIADCGEIFEFVLIGKDQSVKQRWDNFPSFDELYALIDVMPMRRFEMRQRKENN